MIRALVSPSPTPDARSVHPTAGNVRFRDHWFSEADDAGLTHFRREHVGFVFQFYNLIPCLAALENLALVTEIAERPMDPREALRLMGLTERQNHFPSQLSSSKQQRGTMDGTLNVPVLLDRDERLIRNA